MYFFIIKSHLYDPLVQRTFFIPTQISPVNRCQMLLKIQIVMSAMNQKNKNDSKMSNRERNCKEIAVSSQFHIVHTYELYEGCSKNHRIRPPSF